MESTGGEPDVVGTGKKARDILFYSNAMSDRLVIQSAARRLRIFRFVEALGGHANDGDMLFARLPYRSTLEMEHIFDVMGLQVRKHAEEPERRIPGQAYTMEEMDRIPALIPATRWWEQFGWTQVTGEPVFVWSTGEAVVLTISDGYVVTPKNVASAEKVEAVLHKANVAWIDPPEETPRCICPKYHPEYFSP